jgi:hypothetical protein
MDFPLERAMKLVRRDRPDVPIVAVMEQVPASAAVVAATLDARSRMDLEYAGGSDLDWDGQTAMTRGGERVFLDAGGEAVMETNVALKLGEATLIPGWRPQAPPQAIEPMLTISAEHVRPATFDALRGGRDSGAAPHRLIVHDYGAILFVGEAAPCLADLAAVLAFARTLRCVWVNLDVDAAAIVDLPVYEALS